MLLTPGELLAFAGLARLVIQADGRFTQDEQVALEAASAELFTEPPAVEGGPYRTQASGEDEEAATKPDPELLWSLIERSQAALPDEDAVRRAAKAVTRQEAREAIFGVLYEVAASDVITKSEWPLVEWLASEWNITITQ
jgi:hypothetical protein